MASIDTSHRKIEERIRSYVSAEERAYRIVERLALNNVAREEEVNDIINAITPQHYADIVEERSASKQCGYLLCSEKLEKVVKQKYHISMKAKKVYDMTERKCFCSSSCFEASKWLERQVPNTPLSMRNEPICADLIRPSDSPEDKRVRDHLFHIPPIPEKGIIIGGEPTAEVELYAPEVDMVGRTIMGAGEIHTGVAKRDSLASVKLVKDCLLEWCTKETVDFIQSRKPPIAEEEREERKADGNSQQNNYPSETPANKMVDQLTSVVDSKLHIQEKDQLGGESYKVVPPVDHRAQLLIRRKIVGDRLRRSLGRVLPSLGLQLSDLSSDLTNIIKSFTFSSRNILLSLVEWRLTALVLLRLMAILSTSLQKTLQENREALNGFLMALNTDVDALEDILQALLAKYESTAPGCSEVEELD